MIQNYKFGDTHASVSVTNAFNLLPYEMVDSMVYKIHFRLEHPRIVGSEWLNYITASVKRCFSDKVCGALSVVMAGADWVSLIYYFDSVEESAIHKAASSLIASELCVNVRVVVARDPSHSEWLKFYSHTEVGDELDDYVSGLPEIRPLLFIDEKGNQCNLN